MLSVTPYLRISRENSQESNGNIALYLCFQKDLNNKVKIKPYRHSRSRFRLLFLVLVARTLVRLIHFRLALLFLLLGLLLLFRFLLFRVARTLTGRPAESAALFRLKARMPVSNAEGCFCSACCAGAACCFLAAHSGHTVPSISISGSCSTLVVFIFPFIRDPPLICVSPCSMLNSSL